MQRSRPDTYQPPYPAYQSHFPGDRPEYVMAMIGVQSEDTNSGKEMSERILALLTRDASARPAHVERGVQNDAFGFTNDIFIPYWHTRQAMSEFWKRPDVREWLETPLSGDVGWWRESIVAPVTSVDGSHSVGNIRYGIGRYVEQKVEQFHGYFGSMRDRVTDFLAGSADGETGQIRCNDQLASAGKRLRITRVPDRLCFIRAPFGWDQATPEEQQAFIDDMLPVFKAGADYLRDNPMDANCVSMRFLDEIDMGLDNGAQVEVLGWFLTLKDLEQWTHHHPTHLAIYNGVFKYMERFDFQAKLNLGHEVVVVPQGGALLEYCNCHPKTGFLPFFESEEVAA